MIIEKQLFFLSVADNIKCYDYEGISIGNIEQYINRGNIEAMKHYGLWMILQKLSDEHMLKFRTTMLIGNEFCCCFFYLIIITTVVEFVLFALYSKIF